jgi:threonine dehydrogenase-like Zn-dependent dehydrogenase
MGTMGLLLLQVLRLRGIRDVVCVDLVPAKLKLAKRLGATHALTPQQFTDASGAREFGGGADTVFDCVSSNATIHQAMRASRTRSSIVVVGMPARPSRIDLFDLQRCERKIVGVSMHSTEDLRQAITLLEQHSVDTGLLVSEAYPLSCISEAFGKLSVGPHDAVKILLEPDRDITKLTGLAATSQR